MSTPILDWRSHHDERSRDYAIRELLPTTAIKRRTQLWSPGEVLNQGAEGACVGFAFASEAMAEPVPVDLKRLKANVPPTWELFARFLYGMAQHLDPWPGQNYSGTSVLAGAKAAQNVGVLREYRWAFGLNDVIDTLVTRGPVILGMNWYSGMYSAPGGVLRPSGNLVGGHALAAVGYYADSPRLPGHETVLIKNSWGASWGDKGLAEMPLDALQSLLDQNGEACVPVSRSYGRS